MATKFLEPGGDATFDLLGVNSFWTQTSGTAAIATDFVHGAHIKSIKYAPGTTDAIRTGNGVVSDAGGRFSVYIYLNVLPSATSSLFSIRTANAALQNVSVRLTSAGVLQIWNATTAQIGTDGATLSTGQWYRLSLAYTITDTTHNRFELFKDASSTISITNATITNVTSSCILIGNSSGNANLDFRSSDHYIDDSSSLTDTGNIWVTAKRPNANGTSNDFNTQIGSGGSGYGTGHSPQVNERPLSTTNGWSVVAIAATTEEYNIESKSSGDINISTATIIDYTGWVSAKTLIAETASIVVNGTTSNISLTTTITVFTKIAGSSTYPAGTGTDIGIVTSATATTVSLYECGVIVAFIPVNTNSFLMLM